MDENNDMNTTKIEIYNNIDSEDDLRVSN